MRICLTGANGALGRVVHAALIEAGDQVAGLAGVLPGEKAEASLIPVGDLADPEQARAAVTAAAERLGGLDALIHLAGGFRWLPVTQSRNEDWRALYAANVESAVATIQAALPHMEAGSSIVLVGAKSAEPAGAGMGPYAAAKSGVARLTEALSAELAPMGIRVNAVLPAIIDTPANRKDMPDADFRVWTSPEAVADALRFLAAPASRAVNGALLPVANAA
ncbi:SDR family oxidoreductase [Brevundimonas diminuta]|uniref:SDR family oxidoreductase n=1 Tax=Brevundimonas diminuta TaxID=293 RepID=UPI0037C890FB